MEKTINIALAGNPNSGKTTVFNSLTGSRQHVGNWPGVTVEKKEGISHHEGCWFNVVDLPGVYSLSALSLDEVVARDYIVESRPDIVVDIIDSSNLERNLYLAMELIELGFSTRLIFVFNMFDIVLKRNQKIDVEGLSSLLGVPIITTIGTTGKGIDLLKDKILEVYNNPKPPRPKPVNYGSELEHEIRKLSQRLDRQKDMKEKFSLRWLAIKLLEQDQSVIDGVTRTDQGKTEVLPYLDKVKNHLNQVFGENSDIVIADRRYGHISGLLREVGYFDTAVDRHTLSDQIDLITTSRAAGIPIFLLLMFITFLLTFQVGGYIQGWMEQGIEIMSTHLAGFMVQAGISSWVISLLIDGIIGGVGGVLIFIPNIFILFFLLSFLEDSGYMARAAFIMDNLMHRMGLHGKSFIPLVMGFGCNVPAIMATRTLEEKKDRLLTILIIPFVSCSARIPIYVLLAGAFFGPWAAVVIFSLYILGLAVAVGTSKLFHKIFFKGLSKPFVMELPPYRKPTIKGAVIHMWENGSEFLKKMGTVILVGSAIIWLLGALPLGAEYASQDSIAGKIGLFIAPLLKPLGFGWIESIALLFGFVAKEIVVGTFGVVLGATEAGQQGLTEAIRSLMTPLKAYTFLVFTLLYTPCLGTVAAIKRETGSYRWTFFSIAYSLAVAWIISFIIYQLGLLIGLG
ncbi:MAG: ferrous iron transport protein B [Actinomycetia bacterium]|nr:ferrous iron transport protein B [Actinomycetes bacterium]